MDQILVRIETVNTDYDDILVGAADEKSCQNKLYKNLERLSKYNVRLNVDKCKFYKHSVDYLRISGKGISSSVKKMRPFKRHLFPQNLTMLIFYLGLIQTILELLHKLLN